MEKRDFDQEALGSVPLKDLIARMSTERQQSRRETGSTLLRAEAVGQLMGREEVTIIEPLTTQKSNSDFPAVPTTVESYSTFRAQFKQLADGDVPTGPMLDSAPASGRAAMVDSGLPGLADEMSAAWTVSTQGATPRASTESSSSPFSMLQQRGIPLGGRTLPGRTIKRTAGETKGVEPVDVMMRERVEATEDELFRPLPAGRLPADGSWASPSHSGATLPANRFPTFEELEAAARAMEKQEFEGTATKQRQIEEQALAEWGTPVEGTVEIIDGVEVFTTTLPSDSASSRGGPRATKVNGFIGDGGDSLSRAQHSVGKDDWERELLQEMQSEEGSGMGEEGSSEGPEGDEVFDSRFPGLEREDTTTITEVMSFGDAEEERKQE